MRASRKKRNPYRMARPLDRIRGKKNGEPFNPTFPGPWRAGQFKGSRQWLIAVSLLAVL